MKRYIKFFIIEETLAITSFLLSLPFLGTIYFWFECIPSQIIVWSFILYWVWTDHKKIGYSGA